MKKYHLYKESLLGLKLMMLTDWEDFRECKCQKEGENNEIH